MDLNTKWSLEMHNVKVIIVEDEPIAAEFLKDILEQYGVEVLAIIDTGKEAISSCIEMQPDVVFMDIMLEDNISGAEAALAISKQSDVKIIFLTAYTNPEMVDYAVASKAVGYLNKPYNEAQIIANLRLATEQHSHSTKEASSPETPILLIGGFVYNTEQKRLLKDSKEVELGHKTLQLIQLLCTQPNISISNEQISMHIWDKIVDDRTLRSLVFRARSATDDRLIKNISGTGYMIQLQ